MKLLKELKSYWTEELHVVEKILYIALGISVLMMIVGTIGKIVLYIKQ